MSLKFKNLEVSLLGGGKESDGYEGILADRLDVCGAGANTSPPPPPPPEPPDCGESNNAEDRADSRQVRSSREIQALQQALTELLAMGASDLEAAKLQGASGRFPGSPG